MSKKGFVHGKGQYLKWMILAAAALVAVALAAVFLYQGNSGIEITADYVEEGRISTAGVFTVRGAEKMSADELASLLAFDPDKDFRLQKREDGVFLLSTYTSLEAGKPVVISLLDGGGAAQRRWEFQTSERFEVTGVFPADGAENVPPSSSIEITFSYGDLMDSGRVDGLVTVTGSTAGEIKVRLIPYGNRLVVLPEEEYYPDNQTLQVTLSASMARESGETLDEDLVFQFSTSAADKWEHRLSSMDARVTENILPGDDVLLKLAVGSGLRDADIPLTTTVYRFASPEAYEEALNAYRDVRIAGEYSDWSNRSIHDPWQVDVSGLEELYRFAASAVALAQDSGNQYVLLPEALEPGWYAATIEATTPAGAHVQASKLIQVSPLAVFTIQTDRYTAEGESAMLAWINDTDTGRPVEGAEITVTSPLFSLQGATGEDGLATLSGTVRENNRETDSSYDAVTGLLEVRTGGQIFLDYYGDMGNGQSERVRRKDASNDYAGYLFTDRQVYRHTDTVKVWGIVRPLEAGGALPANLRLDTYDNTLGIPVQLREDGTFLQEIELTAVGGRSISLRLVDEEDNDYSAYHWIKLEDYTKPEYQTTVTPDRPVFAAWEDYGYGEGMVSMDFTASYFEGTPARNYSAVARVPDEDYAYPEIPFEPVEVTTDGDGYAKVVFQPLTEELDGNYLEQWRPFEVSYGIYSDAELATPQVQGGTVRYLARDIMLLLEAGTDGSSVTAKAYHIDFSNIRDEADLLVDENLRGAPADVEFTATVSHSWYERVPAGERYDAVNKVTVTAFDYEHREEEVWSGTISAEDGVATFTGLPTGDEGYYTIKISLEDSRGMPVAERLNYSEALNRERVEGDHRFTLLRRESESSALPTGERFGQGFEDGETLDIYLADYEEEYTDSDGSLLYLVAHDEIIHHGLVSGTGFQLPFDERYLPNYNLMGAYFDGKYVYALSTSSMAFLPGSRELLIDIQPNAERYSPGDTATIQFHVTEKSSGRSVAGARLLVSMVDEAVFAIQEQEADFLNKYYRYRSYGEMIKYTSYDNHMVDGGGYGAGGPSDFSPRVDFPDTAAFTELTTGEDGAAILQVTMPDNLTDWRITTLALSGDQRYAGDSKNRVSVNMPFFIIPALPPRLLAGDDLSITVHSAGMEVDPDDIVSYTCRIEGLEDSYTASGQAGDFTPIQLNQLPEVELPVGDYQITVTGEWHGFTDAVTLPLPVAQSGVTVSVTERMPLSEAASLQSQLWPVTLGFYDRENELNIRILSHLAAQDGVRIDQKLALRYAVEQLLHSGMDRGALDTAILGEEFQEYAPDYTGYRLFSYGAADEVLTARIWLMAPDAEERGSLYNLEEMADDPAQRAATRLLFSRWNRGRGDLEEIRSMLDNNAYAFRDKMLLVAALYEMGYQTEAVERFDALATALRVEQTDADGNELVMISTGPEDTAAASMVASQLRHPDATGLARYLLDAPVTGEEYLLELMYYHRQHPTGSSGASVTYTRGGEAVTEVLDQGFAYRSFTREQLAEADLQAQGDVWVSAVYTAGLDRALDRENGTLVLHKTVEPVDGTVLRQGDLARITLRLEIPGTVRMESKAQLLIQDYIPTGMRYESIEADTGWHKVSQDDQRVSFAADREAAGELVFYARCTAPGSYVVESAFGSTASGSAWGVTGRDVVEIQP